MARTKEQMASILASHKQKDIFQGFAWSDFASAVNNTDATERASILGAVITKEDTQVGFMLRSVLWRYAGTLAKQNADAILADGTINLAELDSLL